MPTSVQSVDWLAVAGGPLSEGDILRGILDRLGPSEALVGPGDDAAVLSAPDGRVVATTDTLVHGPDFRLAWSSGFDLGWKAALKANPHLAAGLNVHEGQVTYEAVARDLGYDYVPVASLVS